MFGVAPAVRLPGGELAHRVVVVDDQDEVRQSIVAFIEQTTGYSVVGQAASTPEAIEVVEGADPDLVVVDLILGDGPDGIQLLKGIKAGRPLVPVLMLSGRDESVFAERAVLAGASGYLMKQRAIDALATAMNTALHGGIWLSDTMRRRLLPEGMGTELSAVPNLPPWVRRGLVGQLRQGNRTVTGLAQALERSHVEVERGLDLVCRALRLPSRAALFLYLQEQELAVGH
jgi:DNA-binding NarL/FixJ family response regulator